MPTGAAAEAVAGPEAEIAALKVQLADAEARATAARDAQLRTAAEAENTRRRVERDAATSYKYASEKLLGELLAIADSMELGLKAADAPQAQMQALLEGMQLTHRQLLALFEKHGVRQLDPKGEPFNPDAHQAMTMMESTEVPANHVLAVMQKGYKLHERLLRPAMVMVAKAPVQS
ncbi:MAG: nucleotide exchange factor GrpE [Stenotrophobium sp.]